MRSIPLPIKLAGAFFVIALLPGIAAMVLLQHQWAEESGRRTRQLLTAQTAEREHFLSRQIAELEAVAAQLAGTPSIGEYLSLRESAPTHADDPATSIASDLITTLQDQLWGRTHHIFLVDSSGRVVLSPPHPWAQEITAGDDATPPRDPDIHLGQMLADRPFFPDMIDVPLVTSFDGFEERDHYHQLVTHPVLDKDGQSVGAVVVEVAIDHMVRSLADGLALGHSGRVYLARANGWSITHSKADTPRRIGAPGLDEAIRTGRSVVGEYPSESGVEVLGAYLPSERYPWVVCIEIDRAEVLGPIRSSRARMLGLSVVLGVLFALLGCWIGWHFGRPLHHLALEASQMAEGRFEEPVRTTKRGELGRLQTALETLRQRSRDQIRFLDESVSERTLELEQATAVMTASQERLELALRGSQDAIFDWHVGTDQCFYSERWMSLLGTPASSITSEIEFLLARVAPEDAQRVRAQLDSFKTQPVERLDTEFRLVRDDATPVWVMCRAAALRDANGAARRISGSVADISGLKGAEQELRRAAHTDRLTGLANRTHLLQRLEAALNRYRATGKLCALLFFDFDRFKVVNDSLGHDAGDALLCSIAARLKQSTR